MAELGIAVKCRYDISYKNTLYPIRIRLIHLLSLSFYYSVLLND